MAGERPEVQIELTAVSNIAETAKEDAAALENLGRATQQAGQVIATQMDNVAAATDKSSKAMSAADRNITRQIERRIEASKKERAELEAGAKGTVAYYEALARLQQGDATRIGASLAALRQEEDARKKVAAAVEEQRIKQAALNQLAQQEAALSKSREQFIESLRREADAIGKTRNELLALKAAELGVGEQAAPFLARLQATEKQFDATGRSVAATNALLRQVPQQFTDIVVSLASGQQPLTVFLQQGGQLKDMFGSAGEAARALGGYVLGLVNPFTLAAAAVSALAFGYIQGSKEAEAFNKALILTGNQVGTTAAALEVMSVRISSIGVTQGRASAALVDFVNNAKVGADNLEEFTRIALAFERAGGGAAEEVAKQFAKLAKEPLEASLELNNALGYLSRSTAEQIRLLEQQGNRTEAVRVAQQAYADALREVTPQLVNNLGIIQRGWQAIADTAKNALDRLLDVGRTDIGYQLTQAQARLATLQSAYRPGEELRGLDRREAEALEARIAGLSAILEFERNIAAQKAAGLAQENAAINIQNELVKGLSREEQLQIAIKKARADAAAAGITDEKEIARLIEVRTKGLIENEKATRRSTAAARDETQSLNKLVGLNADYTQSLRDLVALREKGTLNEQAYIAAVETLIQKQPFATQLTKDQAAAEKEIQETRRKIAEEREKYRAGIDKDIDSIEKQIRSLEDERNKLTMTEEELRKVTLARIDEQAAMVKAEITRLSMLPGMDMETDKLNEQYQALLRLKDAQTSLGDARDRKRVEDAIRKDAEKAQKEWEKSAEQIERALTDSLMRGFESGKGFAENLRDTVVNMFKTMVLRPTIQAIVQPVAQGITSSLGLPTGSSAPGGGMGSSWLGSMSGSAGSFGTAFSNAGNLTWGTATDAASAMWSTGSYASAAGTIAGKVAPYLGYAAALNSAAEGRYIEAVFTAAGTYFGGSLGATIGAAIGGAVEDALSGETRVGSSYGYARSGGDVNIFGGTIELPTGLVSGNLGGPSGGVIGGTEGDLAVQQAIGVTIGGINALFEKLGADSRVDQFWAKLESSDRGRGGVLAGGRLIGGSAFGETGLGSNYDGTLFESGTPTTLTPEEAAQAFGLDLQQSIIQALQAASDELPSLVGDLLANVDAEALTQEQVSAVLQSIDAISMLLDVAARLGIPLESVTTAMAAAAGGVEALTAGLGTYVSNFYSAEEQFALGMEEITRQFTAIGLETVPQTREGFRDLVESLDLTTEAGQSQYGALIALSGAFAQLVPATETAAEVVEEVAQAQRASAAEIADLYRTVGLEAEAAAIDNQLLAKAFKEIGVVAPRTREELQRLVLAASPEQAAVIAQFADALLDLPEAIGPVQDALDALIQRLSTSAADALALTQEWPTRDDWIDYYSNAGFEGAAALLAEEYAADWRLAFSQLNLDAPIPTNWEEFNQLVESVRLLSETTPGAGNTLLQLLALRDEFARTLPPVVQEVIDEILDGTTPADRPTGDDGAAQRAADERYRLETQLLELQGDTTTLRQRELLLLDPANRALQERIWAITDQQAADRAAAEEAERIAQEQAKAAEEAAAAAEKVKEAWRGITETLLDEVKRIRGEIVAGGRGSYSTLSAQFALATAAARAGDQGAAQSLTGLAGQLITAGEAEARTLLEAQQIRARIAESLETTAEIVDPDKATLPQTGSIARVAAEIELLRNDQRAQASAQNDLFLRVARLVERWDGDGLPTTRVEA